MRTKSGFEIQNPETLLKGFLNEIYPYYDGVQIQQDDTMSVIDVALSTMLNSRISGNTASKIIYTCSSKVNKALRNIPKNIDLLDVTEVEIPGQHGICDGLQSICEVHRAKLSVATKILHKKRPGLIGIFDSLVIDHYHSLLNPEQKRARWGEYALHLTRLVHADLLSVHKEMSNLRELASKLNMPMTGNRILNAFIWSVKANRADELRKSA